jgi:hypothetical protein
VQIVRIYKGYLEPVQTEQNRSGPVQFGTVFHFQKPELKLTVRFFCGSVRSGSRLFPVQWTGPSNPTHNHVGQS